MRIGNLSGRLTIFTEAGAVDVEKASEGAFSPDPQDVYARWADFRTWSAEADLAEAKPFDHADLGCPTPEPGQIFAVGLNYHSHAAEAGISDPGTTPLIFTKFASSLTGPVATVEVPKGDVDWETELVVVIGREAYHVAAADAWSYVAGLTVGQDLSERKLQMAGVAPQFSLSKSYPGFAPVGPWVTSLDEFANPDDVLIECSLNGQAMQSERTTDMVFSVPTIIEFLSAVAPLRPGDIIFTGTPSGVGLFRKPPRFLRPGDELVSRIDGVGEIRQIFA
ncbi:fumarylacetoacetate hydrolase family protein [Streptomyces sp. NPDC047081]|uniref:fumarylacetoacetate hydrolase family protein n=1 Tax=Streptomyces sp. NPDC047081 TaxID=3154706 RepID=UPI0033DABF7B